MRLVIGLLWCAAATYAACTVTPNTITFRQVYNGLQAPSQTLAVSADCGPWATSMGTFPGSVYPASGTGAATLFLHPTTALNRAVGTTNHTITVAGQSVSVALQIAARDPWALVGIRKRDAESTICTYTTTQEQNLVRDDCPDSTMAPGGSFVMPPLGWTWKDALTSNRVRFVAPYGLEYTYRNVISADGRYLLTSSAPSEADRAASGIYALDGSGKKWDHPFWPDGGASAYGYRPCQFSGITPNKLYCGPDSNDKSVRSVTLNADGSFTRNGVVWTSPYNRPLQDGGTMTIAPDDWACYTTDDPADPIYLVCVNLANPTQWAQINLQTLTPPIQMSLDPRGVGYIIDFPRISFGRSASTGKRYVRLAAAASLSKAGFFARIFEFDDRATVWPQPITLTTGGPAKHEWPISAGPGEWGTACTAFQAANGYCAAGNHQGDIFVGGEPYYVQGLERNRSAYASWGTLYSFAKGELLGVERNAGGGAIAAGPSGEYVVGASKAPVFVTTRQNLAVRPFYTIVSCTAANPTVCTLDRPPRWAGTDSVLIAHATGNTALNGSVTLSGASGNTITLPVSNAGNTYTPGSARVTLNDQRIIYTLGACTATNPAVCTLNEPAGWYGAVTVVGSGATGNLAFNGTITATASTNSTTIAIPVDNSAGTYTANSAGARLIYTIVSCTAANPTVCTLDRTPAWAAGESVLIWNATGNTALNSAVSVSAVNNATVTLPVDNSLGTYTAGSGRIVLNEPRGRFVLTVCTKANPTVCTLNQSAGWSGSVPVLLSGAAGNTALDGSLVVTAANPTVITLPVDNSLGTYNEDSGRVRSNRTTPEYAMNTLHVTRVADDGRPLQIRTLAKSHNVAYDTYRSISKLVISPDGSLAAWSANGGRPGDVVYTFGAETGFGPWPQNWFAPGHAMHVSARSQTSVTLSLTVPDRQSYTCSADNVSGATATSAGPDMVRTIIVPNLSAGTSYFIRCVSADNWYAAGVHVATP